MLCAAAVATPGEAAERTIAATSIKARTHRGRDDRVFVFVARDRRIRMKDFDPTSDGSALVVAGLGDDPRSSGRIDLDPARWNEKLRDGERVAWRYLDRTGSRGGIRKVIWADGRLLVKARGPGWPWKPPADPSDVWVVWLGEDDTLCADFAAAQGTDVRRSDAGLYKARDAARPPACPATLCGNGVEEAGEQCDDGNAVDDDGCTNACTIGTCGSPDFDSTYDAIQAVIFDAPEYQCASAACHGTTQSGDLDLRPGVSFDELQTRLVPGDSAASLVWQKIAERTLGAPDAPNAAMPIGNSAVLAEELEALALWIDAGAQRDAVVPGTDVLLGVCLPTPAPPPVP
jgi:cysteine-rich repeat protein